MGSLRAKPASRITDLETALLAATARIEELEAERDARPVARWEARRAGWGLQEEHLFLGPLDVGLIVLGAPFKKCHWVGSNFEFEEGFDTPEAAKAAVEEALKTPTSFTSPSPAVR